MLIVVNVMVAVCLIGIASAYGYVQWRLAEIHREKIAALTHINGGKPFTVLVVGSDSRSALAANSGNAQFGPASQTPGQRSDTIMLVRIAPATQQIELMSIPRDLWVNIPGHGQNRINSAFDSGPNLLVATIQAALGIPINHYIEINFDTFQSITDAVGGVSFYFPTPARDHYSLLNVTKAGCVNLSGGQALGFVRARHYEYYQNGYWHFEAESDLARIQRQQAFIKKMVKKAEGQFTNPVALNDIVAGVTKNLTVDSGFGSSLLLDLAKDFHSIDASSIPTLTLPNYGYTTAGGAEVLGLQQPQAAQTIAAFNQFGNAPPPPARTTPTTTAIAPSTITVEVANGTGVPGQAGQMTSLLAGKGYRATTQGVSPASSVSTTKVLYAPKAKAAAQQIAAAIPGGASIAEGDSLSATPYQVEVVTGASYTRAASATTAPSTTATTATTVPGANPVAYALPGLPAGATVPNC